MIDKFGIEEDEDKYKKYRDFGKEGNHGNIKNILKSGKELNSVTKAPK